MFLGFSQDSLQDQPRDQAEIAALWFTIRSRASSSVSRSGLNQSTESRRGKNHCEPACVSVSKAGTQAIEMSVLQCFWLDIADDGHGQPGCWTRVWRHAERLMSKRTFIAIANPLQVHHAQLVSGTNRNDEKSELDAKPKLQSVGCARRKQT